MPAILNGVFSCYYFCSYVFGKNVITITKQFVFQKIIFVPVGVGTGTSFFVEKNNLRHTFGSL